LTNLAPEAPSPIDPARFPFRVTARALGSDGPSVVIEPPEGVFTLHVVTAAGAVQQHGEDPIHGLRLRGDARARYDELVRGLPPGTLVLMAVATPTFPRGSDWFEQRL
jgi:hypothetical protein